MERILKCEFKMCYFIKKRNPKILMKVCNEISIFILNISIPRFIRIFFTVKKR